MKNAKKVAIISLGSILLSLINSCGAKNTPGDSNFGNSETQPVTEHTEFVYEYPELDCGGATFTFLNSTTNWGFYTDIDFDSLTGDILDDAVFNRNRFIEEKFNVKFEVFEDDIDTAYNYLQTAVLAGDNIYDATFCRGDKLSPFILEGYLVNLFDYPYFQLEQPWWDQSIMKQALIGDGEQLYFASTDFSLVGFDGTICLFFNENMMDDHGLEAPYDMVRNGKWTLDRLGEYIKAGTNLNGDENFTWKLGGNSIYGLTSWATCANALLIGSNESYIIKDEKNEPMLGLENKRFYDVAAKIATMLGKAGDYLLLNDDQTANHYELVFKSGRAFFLCAELKASSKYRDMNDNYGIVPMPKYDENQKEYHSFRFTGSLLMAIPVTNQDLKRTGIIMDALAYKSYTDVLPVYYDVNVSQKGLRNEDSIEMLGIIRDSRFFDIGMAYGWTSDLYSAIESALNAGTTDLASIIASNKDKVTESIKKTMELMNKTK
jgi:ABC-type glycerol-3-phosphate transport system substrate-binding protein